MPQYVIVETLESGEIIDHEERFGVWDSCWKTDNQFPRYAYDRIDNDHKDLTDRHARFSWKVWADPDWCDRETERFHAGLYIALPWNLEPITDHFAHVSIENGTMVAFTESPEKGAVDRQTRMKPGRYLARFYPQLSGPEVQALAVALDKATSVRFVETADDIERVYLNGPNSCMSKELSEYSPSEHPVRMYAAGDLQLAYLSAFELSDDRFRASARALVWPAKKLFGRPYGDTARISAALEDLGYERGDLDGARLRRVPYRHGFIAPYIDGDEHKLRDTGSHLVIDCEGNLDAGRTDGLAFYSEEEEEETREYCAYYEEYRDENQVYINDLDQWWCETAAENHAWRCAGTRQWYSDNEISHEVNGRFYSEDYCSENFTYCDGYSEYRDEEMVEVQDTNETVCITYARKCYWSHPETDEWFSEPQTVKDDTANETAEQLEAAV